MIFLMPKEMPKEDIDLETLIQETEAKITNNEYYEDATVNYKNDNIHVRIRPISQSRFTVLSKNKKALDNAEFNTLLIHECVINKNSNKPFTITQIEKLFTGGLAAELALKCCEISGINLNANDLKKLTDF